MAKDKKKLSFPSAYSILLGLMIVIAIITNFVPAVKQTSVADLAMAPVNGMIGVKDLTLEETITKVREKKGLDAAISEIKKSETPYINVWNNGKVIGAIDVALFVLIIGGFLGVVTKTGALDAGVASLVVKLKGKEIYLIPVLMVIFSLGGTTYGMSEESLAFYALITTTMIAAGFDSIVAVATIMLGCGSGVLGSTINPFATGAAVSAASAVGIKINQGITIIIGVVLWFVITGISIVYVMHYAKKVKKDKTKSILSKAEIDAANDTFKDNNADVIEFTTRRKVALTIFALSFVVMILGVIPWENFNITIFSNTSFLLGSSLGAWWFPELTIWFFLVAVVIGMVSGLSEKEIVNSFIAGCSDMMGVALVIGISRGVSFMMANTGLDLLILDKACGVLNNVSGLLFANLAYIIYIGLSFLIPSTSGLASVSMPIFAPLAAKLGMSPEVMVSAFSAGSGIVNLITPTSGVVMGGIAISRVEYSTWVKFVGKLLGIIFIATIIILSIVPLVLGL
ncbi:YfcC family protein [Haloimpatiens sp. FM7315]|uniref:YfcC family protein n=1 Tax=Haloimpatiens sp. FM7315 TaxID=3298609 RepID=UPI00370A86F6